MGLYHREGGKGLTRIANDVEDRFDNDKDGVDLLDLLRGEFCQDPVEEGSAAGGGEFNIAHEPSHARRVFEMVEVLENPAVPVFYNERHKGIDDISPGAEAREGSVVGVELG